MVIRSFERSIRCTEHEWSLVIAAAETAKLSPGGFVHRTAERTAVGDPGLEDARLTLEQAEHIKRTSRNIHVLNCTMRKQLHGAGRVDDFEKTVETAQIAQSQTMGPVGSHAAAPDARSKTHVGVAGT